MCKKRFHACTNPLDVLDYYNDIEGKYCEVEIEDVDSNKENDSRICGKCIKINAEVGFVGLFKLGIEWLKEQTIFSKKEMDDVNNSNKNSAKIGSSGYSAQIGSSGYSAQIGSSGDYAKIGSSGKNSVVMCAGHNSIAKAKIGSWITLSEWGKMDDGNKISTKTN